MDLTVQAKASSTAAVCSLNRQLASISDTLAKASLRRDNEIRVKTSMASIVGPMPTLTATPKPDAERNGDSGLSDRSGELERLHWRVGEGAVDVAKGMETGMMVEIGLESVDTDVSPRGDGESEEDNPRKMLAEMRWMGRSLKDDYNNFEPKGVRVQDNGGITSRLRPVSTGDDDDVDEDDDDPRKTLAALERGTQVLHQSTARTEGDGPRSMLAELERAPPRIRSAFEHTDSGELKALHSRIVTADISSRQVVYDLVRSGIQAPHHSGKNLFTYEKPSDVSRPDIKVTSYAIALLLENKGCEWEKAQGVTAYLFSTGLNGYKAKQQQWLFVKQATEELQNTTYDAIEGERIYLQNEEKARLVRRLHVSNIAAGAAKKDLMELFSQYRGDMYVMSDPDPFMKITTNVNRHSHEINISQQRSPLKRTQSAHIDFCRRKAAVEASYMLGSIFGLYVKTRLAVEETDLF